MIFPTVIMWVFPSRQPTVPLSGHPPGVLQFSSIQFSHYLSGVSVRLHRYKGSVRQGCIASDVSHQCWVSRLPTLPSDLATHQGFPQPTSLRFSNLLKQLTELRKTAYLLLLVYSKGYNSGTAKEERCIGQTMGETGWHRAAIFKCAVQ